MQRKPKLLLGMKASSQNWNTKVNTWIQGCSLGLERLGLDTVSRRFFERLGVVSVSASYVS